MEDLLVSKDTARIIYYKENIDNAMRIIVHKDVDENNSKCKCYKQLMDMGENNYTQKKYDKYCDRWGVYCLQTTIKDAASVVYSDNKGRWSIESYNNYVKNDADFNGLKFQGYYEQHGFDFIMLATGILHEKLNVAVKLINKSSVSTFDVLIEAGHMRMVTTKGSLVASQQTDQESGSV